MFRPEVELVTELVLPLAGIEMPEHALNKRSPNRMVLRAAHRETMVGSACFWCAEPGKR
jgi:hypothetical protein